MRPLEWVFLLSFIPALLIPAVPQEWRRRWVIASALLPVIAGIVHLVAEGVRIQMFALYGLALLVLLSRLPTVLGREGAVHRRRGIVVSAANALIIIGSGVLAGWLLPVISLPQPTGPYQVGIVDRELVDTDRDRKLMVSIWYPAAQSGTPAPLTHNPDEVSTALGNLSGLPGIVMQHLRYINLSASNNAPILVDGAPFPILVFSHGMVGLRLQNSSTLQDLASWGYVVVALDHTDAAAITVFPDGEARYYDLARFGIPANVEPDAQMMVDHVLPVWVADQRFVYDTLEKWEANDSMFAGKIDLTRIGSFGHSFGGETALEVCRVDPRCRASVNLDGGLYGDTVTQPAVRPLLLFTSTEGGQLDYAVAKWSQMIASASDGAYWIELPNSTHFSFTITQLLSPLLIPPGFDPRAGLRIEDKYLRAFFDQTLRGVETPLLSSASGETDVRWLSK